jgi:hypothetical protein
MRQLVYRIVEGPNGRKYSDNAGLKPLEKYSERKLEHYSAGAHAYLIAVPATIISALPI